MRAFAEGTDFTLPEQCKDKQGNAISLSGATNLQVVFHPEPREGASASLTCTVANGGLVVADAGTGLLNIVIEPGDLTAGEYIYEATGDLSGGATVLLFRASLKIFASNVL